jgi:hypothetical protein
VNKRHIRWVPLYNIDPQTGARVEIFYADRALAASFGWLWWRASPAFCRGACRLAHLPAVVPHTAIPAHAALEGLEKTANAGR